MHNWSFENYSREDIVELIEQNGGKYTNTVSKNTNYLILGNLEDQTSKSRKPRYWNNWNKWLLKYFI